MDGSEVTDDRYAEESMNLHQAQRTTAQWQLALTSRCHLT